MSSDSGGRRGGLIWALLAAAVVLTVVLMPKGSEDDPLKSTDSDGFRGLALLLESTGTKVSSINESEFPETASEDGLVVFVMDATGALPQQVAKWRKFAERGGRLVVAAPPKTFGHPVIDPSADKYVDHSTSDGSGVRPGVCDFPDFADLRAVQLWGQGSGIPTMPVQGAESCFGDEHSALLVRRRLGRGELILISTPDLFANTSLGAPERGAPKVTDVPDNAIVAQHLLGSGTSVSFVVRGVSNISLDGGTKSLTDFLPNGVKLAILQLLCALAFLLWARGRRHGKVVVEPVPVEIAGSGFVSAHGNLLERQGAHARAASALRSSTCREIGRRLSLPPNVERTHLATVLSARLDRDPSELYSILQTSTIDSEAELVALAAALDSLRQEALHV